MLTENKIHFIYIYNRHNLPFFVNMALCKCPLTNQNNLCTNIFFILNINFRLHDQRNSPGQNTIAVINFINSRQKCIFLSSHINQKTNVFYISGRLYGGRQAGETEVADIICVIFPCWGEM